MLYASNTASQTVAENGLLSFPNTIIRRNCNVISQGSTFLPKRGTYEVEVDATVAGTGDVVISLYSNGAPYFGSEASYTSTGADDMGSVHITALVDCSGSPCVPQALSVVNTGVSATVTYSSILVKRLS